MLGRADSNFVALVETTTTAPRSVENSNSDSDSNSNSDSGVGGGAGVGGGFGAGAGAGVVVTVSESILQDFTHVIDCSGAHHPTPTFFGRGGIPAVGERSLVGDAHHLCNDIADDLTDDYFDEDTKDNCYAVFGSGYSAATTVRNLLGRKNTLRVYWLMRRVPTEDSPLYPVIENDILPSRADLCSSSNELCFGFGEEEDERCKVLANACCSKVTRVGGADAEFITLTLEELIPELEQEGFVPDEIRVHKIYNNVGLKPDQSTTEELQVHYCYASQGPMKLAASLGAGGGDCLAQVSAGIDVLKSPEPNFFILGIKSYGRNSAYLLKLGFDQAKEVAAFITGVEVTMEETMVSNNWIDS